MKKIVTQKYCPKCKQTKDADNFYKDKRTPDGLYGICKPCHHLIAKRWRDTKQTDEQKQNHKIKVKRWRENNLEKARARDRQWYAENAEYKKMYQKERYSPEYNRQYYLSNKDRQSALNSMWKKTNKDKVRLFTNKRRAMIQGAGGTITEKEWKELCEKYDNTCLRCKRNDVKLTLDHIKPLIEGGSNTIDNAQPLCLSCNSQKGRKTIDFRHVREV